MSAGAITGAALCFRIARLSRRFTPSHISLSHTLDELPTVSVCIPARNETHAMTQCLERVVASIYPKLEIIVLDDSSVDDTSILIKSFAHAGVRFVEGSPLPAGWIGKTHAQQSLYREASGEYIFYMDVDTLISPQSIDALVSVALKNDASMVSVLPTREDSWRASVLFATLRYFWTILAHGQTRPAVSSSAWLIKRSLLEEEFKGLEALQAAIIPESNVANVAIEKKKYRFLINTTELGISYEKKWRSQCETSVRLLYPLLGGSVSRAILALVALLFLLLPFFVTASAVVTDWTQLHTLSLAATLLLVASYTIYTARVWRRGWLVGGVLFPVILLQEVILLVRSVYAYSTNKVHWKGRPLRRSARDVAAL